MRSVLSSRLPSLLLLVLGTAAGPVALLLAVGGKEIELSGEFHFWAIAAASAIAAAAAFALTAAGARRGDGRTVVMGTAFAAMATLLLVHGVSTPGVLAEHNGVVAIAGAGVLPIGAIILAASTHPRLARPRSIATCCGCRRGSSRRSSPWASSACSPRACSRAFRARAALKRWPS